VRQAHERGRGTIQGENLWKTLSKTTLIQPGGKRGKNGINLQGGKRKTARDNRYRLPGVSGGKPDRQIVLSLLVPGGSRTWEGPFELMQDHERIDGMCPNAASRKKGKKA